MKNILPFTIIILWSSFSLSKITTPYVPIFESNYEFNKEEFNAKAIPPVKNQLFEDNCWAVTGTYMFESIVCQKEKISDCSKLNSIKPELVVSPLAFSGLYKKIREDDTSCSTTLSKLLLNGGTVSGAWKNFNEFSCVGLPSDMCYPLEKFYNQRSIHLNFSEKIKTNSLGKDPQGNTCIECAIQEVQNSIGTTVPEKAIKSFKEVMDSQNLVGQTIFNDCRKKGQYIDMGHPSPKIKDFPPYKIDSNGFRTKLYADQFSNQDFINKIREVLANKQQVISMEGFCGEYVDGKCAFYHAHLITGYRKVCKCLSGSGPNCKPNNNDCRELVRVQNTWGESWQKNNNDGWVDAHILMKARDPKELGLTWLEPGSLDRL